MFACYREYTIIYTWRWEYGHIWNVIFYLFIHSDYIGQHNLCKYEIKYHRVIINKLYQLSFLHNTPIILFRLFCFIFHNYLFLHLSHVTITTYFNLCDLSYLKYPIFVLFFCWYRLWQKCLLASVCLPLLLKAQVIFYFYLLLDFTSRAVTPILHLIKQH